jgi:predicted MFS family arabinose efflux permease
MGLTYAVASAMGGCFAQRHGYFAALKWVYAIMALAIGSAVFVKPPPLQFLIMFTAYSGAAMTWPALEALVCEGQSRQDVQRNLGIYNLVWGGTGALAYFLHGAIIDAGTFRALFAVSALLSAVQFFLKMVLERAVQLNKASIEPLRPNGGADAAHDLEQRRSPISPRTFLRMAGQCLCLSRD